MIIVPSSSLLVLLGTPVTDSVVQRWLDYLDANTVTDMTGKGIYQAERAFLLEALSLGSSEDHNSSLWDQYMDQEGFTADSLVQAMQDWLGAGGINVTVSEVTWDMNTFTWDSNQVTFDGNDGVA